MIAFHDATIALYFVLIPMLPIRSYSSGNDLNARVQQPGLHSFPDANSAIPQAARYPESTHRGFGRP
jgi:hypothetical protein